MNLPNRLMLHLTPSWLDEYCVELQRSTATKEKQLIALDALSTFISASAGPALLKDVTFIKVKQILSDHIDRARGELIAERVHQLSDALQRRDVKKIAKVYDSFSRSGFWDIMDKSIISMTATNRNELSAWTNQWLAETKRRGEEASPYPDTIDFKAANIEISDYMAMTDLGKYISTQP